MEIILEQILKDTTLIGMIIIVSVLLVAFIIKMVRELIIVPFTKKRE